MSKFSHDADDDARAMTILRRFLRANEDMSVSICTQRDSKVGII